MHSTRTTIPEALSKEFKQFLEFHQMYSVFVGNYYTKDPFSQSKLICYAYGNYDKVTGEALTMLTLQYGDITKAFYDYYEKNKKHGFQ